VIRERQRLGYRIFNFTLDHELADWRRYRYGYYELVKKVDRGIGMILQSLSDAGLDENTIVIFSADHGDMCGAHQLIQKNVLYDESVRIPLIISGPGAAQPGLVDTSHLISNGLDLYPTICDYAGVQPPEGLEGRSLRPLVEGRTPSEWRDHVVTETSVGPGVQGLMVRTAKWKYAVYDHGLHREQLFDMENDPGEMVNLAVEARCEGVLNEHRRLLWTWCQRTGADFGRHGSHPDLPFMLPGYEYEE
jgi:arylsulfatase A-like enzyme